VGRWTDRTDIVSGGWLESKKVTEYVDTGNCVNYMTTKMKVECPMCVAYTVGLCAVSVYGDVCDDVYGIVGALDCDVVPKV